MPYLSERVGGDVGLLIDLVEKNFTEGALSLGDRLRAHGVPNWRPIAEIAGTIADHMNKRRTNPSLWDVVVVRK